MVASDSRLTLALYALWPWLLLDDPTMEAVLELLCVYTAHCTTGLYVSVCLVCLYVRVFVQALSHHHCLRSANCLSHTHFALKALLSSWVTTEQHCFSLYTKEACFPASHNRHSVRMW